MWIFNAPDIENEAIYIEFIEKIINVQLPNYLNDPELSELVKTYQVHIHSRTCWKYNTEKKIIAKPLDSKFSNEKKQ